MKKTFTTRMPDRVGAFYLADRCITNLGLNITRVSYNKAVDTHTLFIEVEGDEESLARAEGALAALGYLNNDTDLGHVMLIEFMLRNEPGALLPVLELIDSFHFNISYISAQGDSIVSDGHPYQSFKMGLYVENQSEMSLFMHRAALLCDVRALEYDKSQKILDNTVFYLSFANEISDKLGLTRDEKQELILNANRIMQNLDDRGAADGTPLKTFEYIGKFAEILVRSDRDAYVPRMTRLTTAGGISGLLIEPPCGSNTCVFWNDDTVLAVDTGFTCFREELSAVLHEYVPGFAEKEKILFLTHPDVDHTGAMDLFDTVYLSHIAMEHFAKERDGLPACREDNPLHAPYVRICKTLSRYRTPEHVEMRRVEPDDTCPLLPHPIGCLLAPSGIIDILGMHFEVYEGCGG
ncbi:MAG: Zn-dependent hydrolase, partial [Clostridia bacterium]|nr:Zn-dependent hydrolase [Clostridia bacterium]